MLKLQDVNIKWILGAILLSYLLATLFRRQLRIIWLALRLPGPFAYPIIGNALLAVAHNYLVTTAFTCRKDFGPIFRIWITVFPMVLIIEPDYIQKILSSTKHVDKIYFYKMLHNFLGEGLVTSSGAQWRQHRRLIQPYFHMNTLENLFEVSKKGSQVFAAGIEDQIRNRSSQFNITYLINRCVLAILTEAVLGIPINLEASPLQEKKSPFRDAVVTFQRRCVRPWLLLDAIYRMTQESKKETDHKATLGEYIRRIIKERQNGTYENKCLLDYLLQIKETHADFTEEDCINECCTFMLAGQDSVGATLAFLLHEIANQPIVQEKIAAELDSVLGSSEKPLTFSDLKELKYLEQCVKETMRLYPSVPLIARTLGEDVQLGEYTLPEGCEVIIAPFATHRLSDYYPNPDIFDPDRFHTDKAETRHPYAFLPFSAGPRYCMGNKFAMQEIKTIVATILKKYRLSPVPNKQRLDLRYRVTLRASGGIWVNASPRQQGERLP